MWNRFSKNELLPDIVRNENYIEFLWQCDHTTMSMDIQKQIFCLWLTLKQKSFEIIHEPNFVKFKALNFFAKACTASQSALVALKVNNLKFDLVYRFSNWMLDQQLEMELDYHDVCRTII